MISWKCTLPGAHWTTLLIYKWCYWYKLQPLLVCLPSMIPTLFVTSNINISSSPVLQFLKRGLLAVAMFGRNRLRRKCSEHGYVIILVSRDFPNYLAKTVFVNSFKKNSWLSNLTIAENFIITLLRVVRELRPWWVWITTLQKGGSRLALQQKKVSVAKAILLPRYQTCSNTLTTLLYMYM